MVTPTFCISLNFFPKSLGIIDTEGKKTKKIIISSLTRGEFSDMVFPQNTCGIPPALLTTQLRIAADRNVQDPRSFAHNVMQFLQLYMLHDRPDQLLLYLLIAYLL